MTDKLIAAERIGGQQEPNARHLVAKRHVEGLQAAARGRCVDHVVVQQAGHMYELCDLHSSIIHA